MALLDSEDPFGIPDDMPDGTYTSKNGKMRVVIMTIPADKEELTHKKHLRLEPYVTREDL